MPRCQRPSREIPHADPEIKVGRSAGESELPFRCLHPFRAQGSKCFRVSSLRGFTVVVVCFFLRFQFFRIELGDYLVSVNSFVSPLIPVTS